MPKPGPARTDAGVGARSGVRTVVEARPSLSEGEIVVVAGWRISPVVARLARSAALLMASSVRGIGATFGRRRDQVQVPFRQELEPQQPSAVVQGLPTVPQQLSAPSPACPLSPQMLEPQQCLVSVQTPPPSRQQLREPSSSKRLFPQTTVPPAWLHWAEFPLRHSAPSGWLAGKQLPPWQNPFWQSLATEHLLPSGHLREQGPPQSTSLSPPFRTPSSQVALWQTLPEQTNVGQSSFAQHARQTSPQQCPLAQSPSPAQALPIEHLRKQGPPQSTSDSVPFLMPSAQDAGGGGGGVGAGRQRPPRQFRLRQSPSVQHSLQS